MCREKKINDHDNDHDDDEESFPIYFFFNSYFSLSTIFPKLMYFRLLSTIDKCSLLSGKLNLQFNIYLHVL